MPAHRSAAGLAALLLALAASGDATAQTATIRQYQFAPRADGAAYEVVLKQVPRPSPTAHEVLVRIHASRVKSSCTRRGVVA